jgi:hypothetical protein
MSTQTKFLRDRLNRLKAERLQTPEYNLMARTIAANSGTINELTRGAVGGLKASGASPAAIIRAQREGAGQIGKTVSDIYGTAQDAMTRRLETNSARVDQATEQYQQAKFAEEEQKKAAKNSFIKTGLQVAGGVAGFMVGGPAGAAIGSGLGQAAGSFVGGNGQFAIDNLNPEELNQGIMDTASGISSAVNLHSQATQTKAVAGYLTSPAFNTLSEEQKLNIRNAFASGDMNIIKTVVGGYNPALFTTKRNFFSGNWAGLGD